MKISKYNASGNDFVIFTDSVKEDRSKLARTEINPELQAYA